MQPQDTPPQDDSSQDEAQQTPVYEPPEITDLSDGTKPLAAWPGIIVSP